MFILHYLDRDYFGDYIREEYQGAPSDLHKAIFAICTSITASMLEQDNPLESVHQDSLYWLTDELPSFDQHRIETSGEEEISYRARMYLESFLFSIALSFDEDKGLREIAKFRYAKSEEEQDDKNE